MPVPFSAARASSESGRVKEKVRPNDTPAGVPGFDAERELASLHEAIRQAEAKAEGEVVTGELRRQALHKEHAAILRLPSVKDRLAIDGLDVVANSPEEFAAFIKAEIAKWTQVVKAQGIELM